MNMNDDEKDEEHNIDYLDVISNYKHPHNANCLTGSQSPL